MLTKKRNWSDEYTKFGFTFVTELDGTIRPHCMICKITLKNSSMVPSKLNQHFVNKHGDGIYKNTTFDQFKCKRAQFHETPTLPVLGFLSVDQPILTESYEVSYLIAKQGKPHTIGERLVKPVALKVANIMLGKAAETKLSHVPLSNDVIKNRIDDMSNDILQQIIDDLISTPIRFSLQLDESTDVSSISQLLVFVRYVKGHTVKEEFLFCKALTITTKAIDVKKLVDEFFEEYKLSWDMVGAICTDGAPAMLGRHSGFGQLVKINAPHIIVTHCVLHRHALATKTMPQQLIQVFKIIVECVNYVRNSAVKHRIFKELCNEMGSEYEVLLYHSNIRWLSRGKVLNRVFVLRLELAFFLQNNQHSHAKYFEDTNFISMIAYMADIFNSLNCLNLQMQGGGINIMDAEESLSAFQKKLILWKRRVEKHNYASFPLLDEFLNTTDISESEKFLMLNELSKTIFCHLNDLEKSFEGYFPDMNSYPSWVRQPFTFDVTIADENDVYLEELIELQQSRIQKQLFESNNITIFWCHQLTSYPLISKKAIKSLFHLLQHICANNHFQ